MTSENEPIKKRRKDRRPKTDPGLAVGYGRISKDEDKNSISLQAQETDFYKWCSKNGVRSVGWEVDDDVSGATQLQDRGGLPKAIDVLRTQRAGLLVITKRDRLARDGIEAGIIERAVKDRGARIVCVDGTGATDSPTDVFQTRVLDAVAELERGFIRSRTKRALEQKAHKGERVSLIAPYGFEFRPSETDPEASVVVPIAEEQVILSKILEMRAAGASYNGIANILTEDGVPSRGDRWYAATVRDVCLRATSGGPSK